MTTPLNLEFTRHTINGMRVLLSPRPGSGLLAASAIFLRGSVDENESEHGLASYTTAMLLRGTRQRGSERFAFELESLGALISESDGMDHCGVNLRVASSEAPAAMQLLFEALREPAFAAAEHEIYRQELLANLRMAEDEKFSYTYREYLKKFFAGHGYGHSSEGERPDAERITPADCARWHREAFRPETLLFVMVGDFDPAAWSERLAQLTADWSPAAPPRPRAATAPTARELPLNQLHKPDLQQGFIVAGYHSPVITHPTYPALRLASAALGEGFGGRIFTHLRDQKSLAYALGAMLRPYRLGGQQVLYIGTKPQTIDEARHGLLEEAEYLRTHLLTDDELERAREYVIGKFLVGQQSLAARVGTLAWWEDAAGDARQAMEWVDKLRAVTPAQIREAARQWWVNPFVTVLSPSPAGE